MRVLHRSNCDAGQGHPGIAGEIPPGGFSSRFEGAAGSALAIGSVAAIFVIRLALANTLGSVAVFVIFTPAIPVAAVAGGIGPGLLAGALSFLSAYFLSGANGSFWLQMPIFALVGLAIAWMGEMSTMRAARWTGLKKPSRPARHICARSWTPYPMRQW